jgi:hypothetical protein
MRNQIVGKGECIVSLKINLLEQPAPVDREDSNWLAKLFGNFPSAIDLALSRFPDHDKWPEYDPNSQYGIVQFKGESFPNFNAVDERLSLEGFGPDQRTFPFHLATEVVPRCDELWQASQQGEGPRWIHTSSTQSLWRYDVGDLYVPYVDVPPGSRKVDACWVEFDFDDDYGFLVSCK